jgi:hypothetical protein
MQSFRYFPFSTPLLAWARLTSYSKHGLPHLSFNYILWEPGLLETWVFPGDLGTPVFVFIILFFGTSTFTIPGPPVNHHVPLWIWIHSLLLNRLLK